MKKHFMTLMAIVCAIFILSLTGCKKDYAEMIIGPWQETEVIYTVTFNGETSEPFSMLEPDETITVTFNIDNTYTKRTVCEDGSHEDTGTWSIEDNKLTIFEDDYGMTFDIDQLDKKNLTLIYTGIYEENSSYIESIVIKMKRI